MNDIEKLHQVIGVLEEQSSRVNEFNGLLSSVNTAKDQIESVKAILAQLANEQICVVSENKKLFEEYGSRLTKLGTQIDSLCEIQNKILKEIAGLKFLTPEQYEQGRATTEKAVADQINALAEKINLTSVTHISAIKSLRTIVVFGLLALAGGVAFLVNHTFI